MLFMKFDGTRELVRPAGECGAESVQRDGAWALQPDRDDHQQPVDRERSALGARCRRQSHRRRTWCHASVAFDRAVSASKRPRNHQRELDCPKWVAVIADPLRHHDVRAGIAQRVRPPGRVLDEERLQCAGDEVGAR
jgi:hypothetical protein